MFVRIWLRRQSEVKPDLADLRFRISSLKASPTGRGLDYAQAETFNEDREEPGGAWRLARSEQGGCSIPNELAINHL